MSFDMKPFGPKTLAERCGCRNSEKKAKQTRRTALTFVP
jgi:hypothetical protein